MLVTNAMWRNFLRERDFDVEKIPPWGDLGESFEEGFYVLSLIHI